MVSWAIVDKLTSLLPKDDEEAIGQVRQLYTIFNAATVTNLALVPEIVKRGQDPNYRMRPQS
jgi:hypothetical protein